MQTVIVGRAHAIFRTRAAAALLCGALIAGLSTSSLAQGVSRELTIKADLRIMVLGDSITAGIGGSGAPRLGGYLEPLAELLNANGYRATFVGSRADCDPVPALHDEGWPGYVIRARSKGAQGQLLGQVVERALTRYDPNVILVMAGTNDLLNYERNGDTYDQDEIVTSMDLLLRQIFRLRPRARVILAGIVDSPKVPQCMIERFDFGRSCGEGPFDGLRPLVERYASLGYPVFYADMFSAVPRDAKDFPDGLHPATFAYQAIADVWFRVIELASITERGRDAAHPAVVSARNAASTVLSAPKRAGGRPAQRAGRR